MKFVKLSNIKKYATSGSFMLLKIATFDTIGAVTVKEITFKT